MTTYRCPVCGYDKLTAPPYETWPPPAGLAIRPPYEDFLGMPSYEVCDQCGFEFGNDDNPGGSAIPSRGSQSVGLLADHLPAAVGGGTPFFPTLDNWVNLRALETREFETAALRRFEVVRQRHAGSASSTNPASQL